jgi:hypothetical protein
LSRGLRPTQHSKFTQFLAFFISISIGVFLSHVLVRLLQNEFFTTSLAEWMITLIVAAIVVLNTLIILRAVGAFKLLIKQKPYTQTL